MGLSDSDVTDIIVAFRWVADKVYAALLERGKFAWDQFLNNDPFCPACGDCPQPWVKQTSCETDLRMYCNESSPLHTRAMLYGLTGCNGPAARNLTFGWTDLVDLRADVVNFLLVRGEYAWLSAGWSACSQKIGWNSEYLDADFGVPLDEVCREAAPSSGIFVREWSKATITMDCNRWQPGIKWKTDDGDGDGDDYQPIVLHVISPDAVESGSMGNGPDGSRAAPFHSVTAARDALRRRARRQSATVLLHEGFHHPFSLSELDSGRQGAPITYAAAPGEHAVVSGGLTLPPSAFKPWADGPAGALVADLKAHGVTASMLGSMRTKKMGCISDCAHDKAELYLGSQAMTLARYPNKRADGSWQYLHAAVGEHSHWFLMNASDEAAVRVRRWSAANRTAWLHGYWSFDAMDCYRQLATAVINTSTGWENVSFHTEPTNEIQEIYDRVKSNARFLGVNILQELDAEEEYFIDESALTLYFLPPKASPLSSWSTAVVQPILSVSGRSLIHLEHVKHVTISGLTVAYGRWNGISAQQVESVNIVNCIVMAVGRDGIVLNGTESKISGVEVHSTGCGGIKTTGGDGRTLRPGNLQVEWNTIHHTNNWKRTYAPPLGFWGASNVYEGNSVAYVPHSGIIGNGVNMSFVGNTLDTNCFETTDGEHVHLSFSLAPTYPHSL
eukprot:SAG31_NODE_306_length_17979_cov_7.825447_3_plen_672_part_00